MAREVKTNGSIAMNSSSIRRRQFLNQAFNGIGGLALSDMLVAQARAESNQAEVNPLAPRDSHRVRKAKHCIFK